MLLQLKELLIVLVLTTATLFAARPIAINFMTADDFARRRKLWLWLTSVAYLSPNFYIFALFAAPTLIYASRKDSHPAALYVFLLCVIPPYAVTVPMIGLSYLLSADIYVMLALFLVIPALLRLRQNPEAKLIRGLQLMDYLLLSFGLLTSVLYIQAESGYGSVYSATVPDVLRKIFIFFITVYLPYFLVSRSCITRRSLVDVVAAFTLSCAVMCVIALFEAARSWLLYADMGRNWGLQEKISSYIMRGSSLRAMASSGHPLALGTLLAIAFGFWLYLQRYLSSRLQRLTGFVLIVLGLLAAYSRGPWYGAVCIYFAFAALSPYALSKLFKAGLAAVIVALGLYLSPLGARVVAVLPALGGQIDYTDIDYRQRLLARTWEIVRDHPLLGDQQALLRMQDLRQGQGIIDLINTYAGILVGNGFIGLFLFLAFILIALLKSVSSERALRKSDPDFAALGACLGACIIGMLLMFENGSFGTGPKFMFYAIAGLAAAYAAVSAQRPTSKVVK